MFSSEEYHNWTLILNWFSIYFIPVHLISRKNPDLRLKGVANVTLASHFEGTALSYLCSQLWSHNRFPCCLGSLWATLQVCPVLLYVTWQCLVIQLENWYFDNPDIYSNKIHVWISVPRNHHTFPVGIDKSMTQGKGL